MFLVDILIVNGYLVDCLDKKVNLWLSGPNNPTNEI